MGCMTMIEKIEGVKAHAAANYENGWDVFVECHSVEEPEIAKIIRQKHSVVGAVKGIAKHLGLEVLLEVRKEHDAEARAGGALSPEVLEGLAEEVLANLAEMEVPSDAVVEKVLELQEAAGATPIPSDEPVYAGLVPESEEHRAERLASPAYQELMAGDITSPEVAAEVTSDAPVEAPAEVTDLPPVEEQVTETKKSRKGRKGKGRNRSVEEAMSLRTAQ